MDITLRGIFLTSETPEATARFYEEVARLPLEKIGGNGGYVYWRLDRDNMQIAIHEARAFSDHTYPADHGSNLTHLYFHTPDQPAFLKHLEGLNVSPVSTDAVVVTVADPDGRKVMFGTA
ncbi:VOC family protein [Bradyrhizobium sp. INPA03-11B]|uniref:VOC family protein n=1 Tax=Bradyrhizobium sp. INPA03-11B TaxID=418598 RepID=UPI00338FA918